MTLGRETLVPMGKSIASVTREKAAQSMIAALKMRFTRMFVNVS
jgi:hypothetical protein